MHIPQSNGQKARSKDLRPLVAFLAMGGPAALVLAIIRLARQARRKGPSFACTYCGSGLHQDGQNCGNCGAPCPPPPPEPVKAGPSKTVWVATVALWSLGGFTGLHCHAARRHWRGLVYLLGFISIFFTAMSFDVTAPGPVFNGQAVFLIGLALTLLWAYDGVQIMRGRFIR